MLDVVFIAATIGFFVIALAYVYACEKLRGGKDERWECIEPRRVGAAPDLSRLRAAAGGEVLKRYDVEWLVTDLFLSRADTSRYQAAWSLHGQRVQWRAYVSRSGAETSREIDLQAHARWGR